MSKKKKFNLDNDVREELKNALNEENPDVFVNVTSNIIEELGNDINELKNKNIDITNENNLINNGFTKLTNEEKEYYNKLIDNPNLDGEEIAQQIMPTTILLRVFRELEDESPILKYIDFQTVNGAGKIIYTKGGEDTAQWGALTSEIKKQLDFTVKALDISAKKLTAWMAIPKDLLENGLGIYWLDQYVVRYLVRSIRLGLEKAILTGTGVNEPIGLNRNVEGARSEGAEYPLQDKEALTTLSPEELGKIVAKLNEKTEGNIVIAVNAKDYYLKWQPALAYQTQNGTWNYNTLPVDAEVVKTKYLEEGEAIAFRSDKYHFGINLNTKVEKSDEYAFLDDVRTYKVKLLGDGRPEDKNTSILLDITNLKKTDQANI